MTERNPYHEPAGSSEGGRFASGPSGKKGPGKEKVAAEFSQFDLDVHAKERAAWKAAGLGSKSTKEMKTDPKTGEYTEEAKAEHERIVQFLMTHELDEDGNWVKVKYTPVPEGEQRMVTMLGGGSGSGKTSLEDSGLITIDPNTVRVNSDVCKTQIGEFKAMLLKPDPKALPHIASMVHDESSDIADLLVQRVNEGNYNLLADTTGNNSYEKLVEKVTHLAGPNNDPVHAIYVNADADAAWARNVDRFKKNPVRGLVPDTYFFGNHSNVSDVFPRAIEGDLFETYRMFDNRGKVGEAFLVIDGSTPEDFTIHSEKDWEDFLGKFIPPAW